MGSLPRCRYYYNGKVKILVDIKIQNSDGVICVVDCGAIFVLGCLALLLSCEMSYFRYLMLQIHVEIIKMAPNLYVAKIHSKKADTNR